MAGICVGAGKLPFDSAPEDEDALPDLHLALYNNVIVFDHATKLAYCVAWVHRDAHAGVSEAYLAGKRALAAMTDRISPSPHPQPAPRQGMPLHCPSAHAPFQTLAICSTLSLDQMMGSGGSIR